MNNRKWFMYPMAYERFHDKPVNAPSIILSSGVYKGKNGIIWVYTRGNSDLVAVTLVFENETAVKQEQIRFHLTREQVDQLCPCSTGEGFEVCGDLIPSKDFNVIVD